MVDDLRTERKRSGRLHLLTSAAITIGLVELAVNLLQLIYRHAAWNNNGALFLIFDYLEQQEFTWRKFVSKRSATSMMGSSLMHLMVVVCMLVGLWSKNSLLLIPQLSLLSLKFSLCILTAVVSLAKLELVQDEEQQRWIMLCSSLVAAAVNAIFFSVILFVFIATRRRTLQRTTMRLLSRSYSTVWSSDNPSREEEPPTYCSLVPLEDDGLPPPYALFEKTHLEKATHRSCPNLDRPMDGGGSLQLLRLAVKSPA